MSLNNKVEVSIVMPCLNEEEAVGICVKKAKKALEDLGLSGEIIVVDNGSTDNSAQVAQEAGAKVVFEPERGYGSAYLRGFREAQGQILIMGDADNSYDFLQIEKLISPLKDGYDLVIGSRFKGRIRKGAMPFANRYIGNPFLSLVLKILFKVKISDGQSGFRAFSRQAYQKMELHSLGMEFASEMVIAAIRENLKIKEVPIDYSCRKGQSKLNPIQDAWRIISFALIYSPDWLYLIPGLLFFLGGAYFLILIMQGKAIILGHKWDIHIMALASMFSVVGVQIILLGLFAKTFGVIVGFLKEDKLLEFLWQYFKLEKGIFIGTLLVILGMLINFLILRQWVAQGFGPLERIREAIIASTLIIIGIQIIFSSFFFHMLGMKTR